MNKHLKAIVLASMFTASFAPTAYAEFGIDPAQVADVETTLDNGMNDVLNDLIDILSETEGPWMPGPFLCPHAMRAIALVGTGRMSPEEGHSAFIAGLAKDRAEGLETFLKTGAMPSMDSSGLELRFRIKDRRTRDALITMAKDGQAFLTAK